MQQNHFWRIYRVLLLSIILTFLGNSKVYGQQDKTNFYTFVTSFGTKGHGNGELRHPHGMAFSPDKKRLAVCDTANNRIVLFEVRISSNASEPFDITLVPENTIGGIWPFEGSMIPHDSSDKYLERDFWQNKLSQKEVPGRAYHGGQSRTRFAENIPMDRFCRPESLTWLDNVTLLVTDTDNHRIKAISITGEVYFIIGKEGWKSGYFHYPMGIALDKEGKLYVTEPRSNLVRGLTIDFFQRQRVQGNRLQIFTSDYKIDSRLGHMHRLSGRNLRQFKDLTRVYVDNDGNIYLADTGNHRILVADSSLSITKEIKGWKPFYSLRYPYGIDGDNKGNLAIADTGNHKILILNKEGELSQIIGKFGTENGEFSYPREARFGPNNTLFVLDTMNSRIQVFRKPYDPSREELPQTQQATSTLELKLETTPSPSQPKPADSQ